MDHVRVKAPVAILASTSALAPRYEAQTTLFLSVAISPASPVILRTAYPVSDALPFNLVPRAFPFSWGAGGKRPWERGCLPFFIGEIRSRFSEHLRSIRNNTPAAFPVAQHFNSTGHSISDIRVRGMQLCNGTNLQRKQREMRLIFQLGTVQPDGLNVNFSYICALISSSVFQRFSPH